MKSLTALMFLFLCYSCDPMRRMYIKNESSSDAEIIWTLKEMDSLYKSPFFMSNSTEIKFYLQKTKPYNILNMSFGEGAWSPGYLHEITNRLQSLQIKCGSQFFIADTNAVYSFLFAHRKGLGKRKIQLIIRDNQER